MFTRENLVYDYPGFDEDVHVYVAAMKNGEQATGTRLPRNVRGITAIAVYEEYSMTKVAIWSYEFSCWL